ncbi:MAG: DUF2158 domain-containing protein [Syntrophobacteraceae bacterium]
MQVGDIVHLKSGRPTMTIKKETIGHQVICQWFVGKELKEGNFAIESLEEGPAPKGMIAIA